MIDPGQRVTTLTAPRKLYYAGREQLAPIVFFSAIVSASYEHVADANPHYGSDGNGMPSASARPCCVRRPTG